MSALLRKRTNSGRLVMSALCQQRKCPVNSAPKKKPPESGFDLVLRLADQVVISASVDFGEVKKRRLQMHLNRKEGLPCDPNFAEFQRDDAALAMNSATTSG